MFFFFILKYELVTMTVGNDYELIDSVILMTFCVFSRSVERDNVYCIVQGRHQEGANGAVVTLFLTERNFTVRM